MQRLILAGALLACLAAPLPATSAPAVTLDGNTWRNWDEHTRRSYLSGALDGAELGATLTVFGCNLQGADDARDSCNKSSIGAYRAGQQRYLQTVSAEQLLQGLDTLYSDPLNRSISLRAGLQVMVYQLGGLPDPQSLIQAYRQRGG